MNITKKLLHASLLTSIIFNLSGCFYKTLAPSEVKKAKEISIKGVNYTPEFNGLDAYYLAKEELVLGSEDSWYIHNEKLYIFKDASSKEEWFRHMSMMNKKATKQWKKLNAPREEEKFEDMTDAFMNGTSY
ncbi:MAG: hypothetical protein COA44_06415 [Arcobacter sp.]|nr:MAG: hypothetical protein COA44_06415 [Arcobacter sp.]